MRLDSPASRKLGITRALFTEEGYREVLKFRDRTNEYLNKIHPYPPLPSLEPQGEALPVVPIENHSPYRNEHDLQQIKASFIYLQNKLNEHLDRKKKIHKDRL